MHGGADRDLLISHDGGDCLWGGATHLSGDEDDDAFLTEGENQRFQINGTGLDEENYTIIMDFWRDDAVAKPDGNMLCLVPDFEEVQNNMEHYPFDTLRFCYNSSY
jgi:hypothetical protein